MRERESEREWTLIDDDDCAPLAAPPNGILSKTQTLNPKPLPNSQMLNPKPYTLNPKL